LLTIHLKQNSIKHLKKNKRILIIPTGKLIIFHLDLLNKAGPDDEQILSRLFKQNFITPSVTIDVVTSTINANINVNNPIGKRSKRSVRTTRRKTICIQSEINETTNAER